LLTFKSNFDLNTGHAKFLNGSRTKMPLYVYHGEPHYEPLNARNIEHYLVLVCIFFHDTFNRFANLKFSAVNYFLDHNQNIIVLQFHIQEWQQ
jgi:hypothetical protein